ncbi:hypothetical protein C5167_018160 [Papaver somniferum]|uniref:Uncharacterized protein n=1 Tax=Papaver somniferum TaxID=3469 RepID=A0A4Y7IPJ7_PAPSO|nr:hypothetical protein C5167_018160 [Papaver somniferum]
MGNATPNYHPVMKARKLMITQKGKGKKWFVHVTWRRLKKLHHDEANKELVKGIGLIGSDGIPSLVPSTSLYLHDPTLILNIVQRKEAEKGTRCNIMEEKDPESSKKKTPAPKGPSCAVPERSLRHVVGKVAPILRQLKSNLLYMDAALPEEALRPLKSDSLKGSVWRAFTKSAESVIELIRIGYQSEYAHTTTQYPSLFGLTSYYASAQAQDS